MYIFQEIFNTGVVLQDDSDVCLNNSEVDSEHLISIDDSDDDNSCKDTDDKSSGDSNELNNTSNGKERKKLPKTRMKRMPTQMFSCNLCSIKFYTIHRYNIHMLACHNANNNLHINNSQFTCLLCKKTFESQSLLDTHVARAHTKEKSINCIKCNKVFWYRSYKTSSNIQNTESLVGNDHRKIQFTCFHCRLKCT